MKIERRWKEKVRKGKERKDSQARKIKGKGLKREREKKREGRRESRLGSRPSFS